MTASRYAFRRLLRFSLMYRCELAIWAFPMFSPAQIRHLYEFRRLTRRHMLENRRLPRLGRIASRSPAQVHKMRELSRDPSNR